MIPVMLQPEPPSFDVDVRQPGNTWLTERGFSAEKPLPPRAKPPTLWQKCLDDLHSSYGGVCAYLAVYIERATGAASTDHFVAKSANAGLTYEWSNYRLACLAMNARKRAFDDVIDPFLMPPDVFRLELISGRIFVNPRLTGPIALEATNTMERLKLDAPNNREMRARYFQTYTDGEITGAFLKKMAPFVWAEANRQGLL